MEFNSPVFLAFPLPLAQELDAGAVHQQVQRAGRGSVGQLHLQCLLASAHGAEVGHPPIQVCQVQQALHQSQALAQGQTKKAFDAQAELDGGVAEHVLPTPLAAGGCVPLHVFVQPDRQRAPGFERCVVRCPVGGLVAGLGALGFTHVPRLTVRGAGFVQQSHRQEHSALSSSPKYAGGSRASYISFHILSSSLTARNPFKVVMKKNQIISLFFYFYSVFAFSQTCTNAVPLPDELIPADRVQWSNNRTSNTLLQDSYTYSPGGTTYTCGTLLNDSDKRDTRIVANAKPTSLFGLIDVPQTASEGTVTYRRLNNVGTQTNQSYIDYSFTMASAMHPGEKFLLRRVAWANNSGGYFAARGNYTYDIKMLGDGFEDSATQQLVPATSRSGGSSSSALVFSSVQSEVLDRMLQPEKEYTLRISIWNALDNKAFWDDTYAVIRVIPSVTLSCDKTDLNDSVNQSSVCTVSVSRPITVDLPVSLTVPNGNSRFTTNCVNPLVIPAGQISAHCEISATANNTPGDGSVTASLSLVGVDSVKHTKNAYVTYGNLKSEVVIHNDDASIEVKAVDDASETTLDTPVKIRVLENDSTSDPTSFPLANQANQVSPPSNGTVIYNSDGTVTYTPNSGYTGDDSFSYKICAVNQGVLTDYCATAEVKINVKAAFPQGSLHAVPVNSRWMIALTIFLVFFIFLRMRKGF